MQDTKKSIKFIRNLIKDNRFVDALSMTETELKSAKYTEAQKQILLYLKARSLFQLNELDSAKKIISAVLQSKNIEEINHLHVSILILLVELNLKNNSIKEATKVLDQAEKILGKKTIKNDFELQAKLDFVKGQLKRRAGEVKEALKSYKTSLKQYINLNNGIAILQCYNCIGISLSMLGEFKAAIEQLNAGLKHVKAKNEQHTLEKSKLLNNLGLVFWKKGEFSQALNYYKESLELLEELGEKRLKAITTSNIGLIFWNQGKLDKALEYFNRSLLSFEEIGMEAEKASVLNNIGIIFTNKGALDKALKFYNKNLAINLKLNNQVKLAISYNNIGRTHQYKGNLPLAYDFFQRAIKIHTDYGSDLDRSGTLRNLVEVTLLLNEKDKANNFFSQLKNIKTTTENEQIEQSYQYCKALLLKNKARLVEQSKAQQIFKMLLANNSLRYELKIDVTLNLCDMLLKELQQYPESLEIFNELNSLLQELSINAKEQNSYLWLIFTYILQSKIALLKLEVDAGRNYLRKALAISENHGLEYLTILSSSEYDVLLEQLSNWKDFVNRNVSLIERFKLSKIEDTVSNLIKKKILDVPQVKQEEPVVLFIVGDKGIGLYTKQFQHEKKVNEQIIAGFFTAINAILREAFSITGSIELIKHQENTIIMKNLAPITICYVFQGPSYSAIQKLDLLVNSLQSTESLWKLLVKANETGEIGPVKPVLNEMTRFIFSNYV